MRRRHFRNQDVCFLSLAVVMLLVVLLGGCRRYAAPRLRLGSYFGSPVGMSFPDPNDLGHHHYGRKLDEKVGMAYTCRGGFIDIGHVREAADRTAYLSAITFRNLMLDRTQFKFRVIEPSRYWVTISYPDNWNDLSIEDREVIADDVSILLGQYFARTSLVWHEILTWYGFASSGIFSENISAFSWEDTYSDLLGTRLAVCALEDNQQTYDDAMTILLDEALRDLDVQSSDTARRAVNAINGKWFSGGYYFFVDMKKRNFDAGLTDGQITPWLVPGICPDAQPKPLPVPNLEFLDHYGFGMKLEIESREMEKHKIYRDLHMEDLHRRIRPEIHFPEILEQIKKQAADAVKHDSDDDAQDQDDSGN